MRTVRVTLLSSLVAVMVLGMILTLRAQSRVTGGRAEEERHVHGRPTRQHIQNCVAFTRATQIIRIPSQSHQVLPTGVTLPRQNTNIPLSLFWL